MWGVCVCVFGSQDSVPAQSAFLPVQNVLSHFGSRILAGGVSGWPEGESIQAMVKVLVLMEKWEMGKSIVKYSECPLQVSHFFSEVSPGSFSP